MCFVCPKLSLFYFSDIAWFILRQLHFITKTLSPAALLLKGIWNLGSNAWIAWSSTCSLCLIIFFMWFLTLVYILLSNLSRVFISLCITRLVQHESRLCGPTSPCSQNAIDANPICLHLAESLHSSLSRLYPRKRLWPFTYLCLLLLKLFCGIYFYTF